MLPSSISKLLRSLVFQSSSRAFRSDAALEALSMASESHTPKILVLYNYPSISGAFSSLFAHLYHFRINVPCLILPFSSAVPFRVEDLCIRGLTKCYFLDYLGPKGFALELYKRTSCKIVGFDHRKSSLSMTKVLEEECNGDITFHVNLDKSSCTSVYEYFSAQLSRVRAHGDTSIIDPNTRERIEAVLEYIEDGDLHKWNLPDSRAFNIGICQWLSKTNCFSNTSMYEQLMGLNCNNIIDEGNNWISARKIAANKLLEKVKVFKVRLGRGFYGECLGTRADGNSDLSDEIGKELSKKSAAAGLRPIGAVVYMQRNNLKMCLRSTDSGTDTSEIAKAYGGGGSPSSSSFIIRMDEYNTWLSKLSSSEQ